MLKHVDTLDLLPIVVVLWVGCFSIIAFIDGACGWPLAEAFGKTPPRKREACPICDDPQGEGACEAGPCGDLPCDCITCMSEPWAPYVPSERDIAEGYIRELEERVR